MMRNKGVLHAANAAVMKGENEVFLEFCTDKVVWTFVGDQTLKGKDALERWQN